MQTTWGSRANADASDSERMIKRKKTRRYFNSLDEKLHGKLLSNDDMKSYAAYDLKCSQSPSA